MNVRVVTPWFPTPVDPVEGSFIAAQAAALAGRGHEVECCVVRPWMPWPLGSLRLQWATRSRTPLSWEWDDLSAHRHRYVAVPRYLLYGSEGRRMAQSVSDHVGDQRTDVIIAHTELVGEAVLRAGAQGRPPVLVVIHGINRAPGMLSTRRRRGNLRWTLEHADRVVVVGPRLVPVVRGWGAPPEHIRVVPNGFDARLVKSSSNTVREAGGRRLQVLSVSNLVPGKGVEINLRALSLVLREGLDVGYTVIGDGRSRKDLERLAGELRLTQHVRFLGRLEPVRVHNELAASDVFSLPSSPEAFGVAYVEAMAHGKPVVGCIGEGPESFCRDGEHGFLVPPCDPGAVAAAWRRLADEGLRGRFGASARSRAFNEFTWQRSAESLEALLREVCPGGGDSER